MKRAALKAVPVSRLFGPNVFPHGGWTNNSRRAWFDPLVVEDGYHTFVLMGAPEYDRLEADASLLSGLSSADCVEVERFAAYLRARARLPEAQPVVRVFYETACPHCEGGKYTCAMCGDTGKTKFLCSN